MVAKVGKHFKAIVFHGEFGEVLQPKEAKDAKLLFGDQLHCLIVMSYKVLS